MTDNLLIKELCEIKYPGKVDVTDAVMEQVCRNPVLAPVRRRSPWRQLSVAAVACLAIAFGVQFLLIYAHDYNVNQIGNALAEVYSFHADYGNDVESEYTLGFIEALYD